MLITGRFTILASCRGDGEAEGEGVGGKRGGMSSKNSLKEGLCWAEVGGGQPGGAINCLQMNQRCHKQPTIMQVHPWQVHVLLAQHKTCAVRAHSSGCLCVPVFLCFYKLAAVAGATTGVTHPLRIQLARGQGDHAAGAGVLEQRQGVGRLELHHNVAPCAAGALRTQPLLPIQLVQQDGRPGVAGVGEGGGGRGLRIIGTAARIQSQWQLAWTHDLCKPWGLEAGEHRCSVKDGCCGDSGILLVTPSAAAQAVCNPCCHLAAAHPSTPPKSSPHSLGVCLRSAAPLV